MYNFFCGLCCDCHGVCVFRTKTGRRLQRLKAGTKEISGTSPFKLRTSFSASWIATPYPELQYATNSLICNYDMRQNPASWNTITYIRHSLLSAKNAVVSLQLSVKGQENSKSYWHGFQEKGVHTIQFTKWRWRSTPFCLVFEGRKARGTLMTRFHHPCLVVAEEACWSQTRRWGEALYFSISVTEFLASHVPTFALRVY